MGFLDWLKSMFKKEEREEKQKGYNRLETLIKEKIKPTDDEKNLKEQLEKLIKDLEKKDKKLAKALKSYVKKGRYKESPFLLK